MKAKGYTKETIMTVGATGVTLPPFNVGDTIAISQRIKEGDKERIQLFQGDVIAIRQNGASSSFTVRKMGAHGIPVERIIPFHSPLLKEISVVKRGNVRRAKIYYVRDRVGKSAKIKEKRDFKATNVASEASDAVKVTPNKADQAETVSK